MIRLPGLTVIGLFLGAGLVSTPVEIPAERAVLYLAREVPRWSSENGCYSCHNNGDGARALYRARGHSLPVPEKALPSTTNWLRSPETWTHNPGDPRASDKRLAHLQFSLSLAAALSAGVVKDPSLLVTAARQLADYQDQRGCWPVEPAGSLGSPATYGRHLATSLAIGVLEQADAQRFRRPIARGRRWLEQEKAVGTIEHAAVVLALTGGDGADQSSGVNLHLQSLLRSQGGSGGWGPYPNSPSEPFDTALALLALQGHSRESAENAIPASIQRGRRYLIDTQLPGGGWAETTRPSGFESYAQHISTTAWVTIALLETG